MKEDDRTHAWEGLARNVPKMSSPIIIKGITMNKVLATLIAGLFATSVYAQTAPATTATPAVTKTEAKADKQVVKAENAEAMVEAKADGMAEKAATRTSDKRPEAAANAAVKKAGAMADVAKAAPEDNMK